jgi:hypothetical protein
MEIYETAAPSWFWKAKDLAEMNKRIAYGDESVPMNIIREAINLYKTEDMAQKAIAATIREKYGYDKSPRWWGRIIKDNDPEYVPHKPGKKGVNKDAGGKEETEGSSLPQGEQQKS